MNSDKNITQKRCVYTTLIGDYEKLNEQNTSHNSSIEFICLTDDKALTSETWRIQQVQPVFSMDPVRSQRDLKIRPHFHLPEFDQTLYIDNSVILKELPEELFDIYLDDTPFAVPTHSFRETVLDEFIEVSRLGFDDQGRIFEQLNHYLIDHADILDERPFWAAIMLRDSRDDRVRAMLEFWLAHVNRYSRRDQLSMNLAFRMAGLTPKAIPIDNHSSWFHSWPVIEGRDRDKGQRTASISLRPPVARIRALEQALAAQREQHEREMADQSQRQDILAAESLGRYQTMLAEQCERSERALADQQSTLDRALAEEQARYAGLLASPSGRIARRLSHIALRFPRLARLAWRGGLALYWAATFQLPARLRERNLRRQ